MDKKRISFGADPKNGAGKETRTLDPNLGKVVLYQLSYSRMSDSNRLKCCSDLVIGILFKNKVVSTYFKSTVCQMNKIPPN